MSEDQQPPGPLRQRLAAEKVRPEATRPVERIPLEDPAVLLMGEPEAEPGLEAERDRDPAALLLANSLAGGGRRSWFWRIFLAGLGLGLAAGAAWLLERALAAAADGSLLGLLSAGAVGLIGLALLGLILGELVALARLRGRGALRGTVDGALADGGGEAIEAALVALEGVHRDRLELGWALARYREQAAEVPDAADRLLIYERNVQGPLDEACLKAIVRVARRTAVLTAISPNVVLAAALVLWQSLSVIRSVARIQGLRPGLLASGALVRRTATAMLAAGAMEALHDFAPDAVAGGLLRKAAGRLGEGAVNGYLTVRLGLAALDATRPMPFRARTRPSPRQVFGQALGV
jgi:putative membrane protein